MAAVEGMKRFSGDPVFRFFYGVALVLEGRTQEGIRELDPLQSYPEVPLILYRYFVIKIFLLGHAGVTFGADTRA